MSMPFCGLDISALLDETQTTGTECAGALLRSKFDEFTRFQILGSGVRRDHLRELLGKTVIRPSADNLQP